MADVFISYCSADRELARGVEDELRRAGLTSIWWDAELRSVDRYRHTLKQELTAAKAVIILWTANAVASHWVAAEASLAAHLGTHVPLRNPDLRSKELPLPFAEFEAANIYDTEAWLATVQQRIGGALARASDHARFSDERWAGVWLLDPKLVPYEPGDAGPSPASLLVARHAIVPFIEIAGEKAALIAWAEGTTNDPTAQRAVSGRLIHAPGGFGKTRLVIEAAHHLADRGWHAGFVERGIINGPDPVRTERLRKLIVEPIADRPLLIAVDYAESRADDVDWLVARLPERRAKGQARARLVLLGRADGDWWKTLAKATDPARILCDAAGRPDAHALGGAGEAFTADRREAFFFTSVAAFREVLTAAGRQLPATPPGPGQIARVRSEQDRDRPLALQPRRAVDKALVAVIQVGHVHGISTRSVADLVKAMGMTGISKPSQLRN